MNDVMHGQSSFSFVHSISLFPSHPSILSALQHLLPTPSSSLSTSHLLPSLLSSPHSLIPFSSFASLMTPHQAKAYTSGRTAGHTRGSGVVESFMATEPTSGLPIPFIPASGSRASMLVAFFVLSVFPKHKKSFFFSLALLLKSSGVENCKKYTQSY